MHAEVPRCAIRLAPTTPDLAGQRAVDSLEVRMRLRVAPEGKTRRYRGPLPVAISFELSPISRAMRAAHACSLVLLGPPRA